jgi:hypothetical protein
MIKVNIGIMLLATYQINGHIFAFHPGMPVFQENWAGYIFLALCVAIISLLGQ